MHQAISVSPRFASIYLGANDPVSTLPQVMFVNDLRNRVFYREGNKDVPIGLYDNSGIFANNAEFVERVFLKLGSDIAQEDDRSLRSVGNDNFRLNEYLESCNIGDVRSKLEEFLTQAIAVYTQARLPQDQNQFERGVRYLKHVQGKLFNVNEADKAQNPAKFADVVLSKKGEAQPAHRINLKFLPQPTASALIMSLTQKQIQAMVDALKSTMHHGKPWPEQDLADIKIQLTEWVTTGNMTTRPLSARFFGFAFTNDENVPVMVDALAQESTFSEEELEQIHKELLQEGQNERGRQYNKSGTYAFLKSNV